MRRRPRASPIAPSPLDAQPLAPPAQVSEDDETSKLILDTQEEGTVCEDMCSFEPGVEAVEGYSEVS